MPIWVDPKIAHLVPADLSGDSDKRIDEVFTAVEKFMKSEGYSYVPTMGDDFYVAKTVKDENGIEGFISGNDWGNVQKTIKEQLDKVGLEAEFVEFLGSAWFRIVQTNPSVSGAMKAANKILDRIESTNSRISSDELRNIIYKESGLETLIQAIEQRISNCQECHGKGDKPHPWREDIRTICRSCDDLRDALRIASTR